MDGVPIEALLTKLNFPSGQSINLVIVYRSPSVPIDDLLDIIRTILTHLQNSDSVSIIMGDFNEDLLANPDSNLAALMTQCGFSQLVHTPTTDKGTLIDHVYCDSPMPQCAHIHVADTYYSDHDTIVIIL